MFRAKTVNRQILPLLSGIRARIEGGATVQDACRKATHDLSKAVRRTYQTLEDGCRRRLDLDDIRDFHDLVESWIHDGSPDLKERLTRHAEAAAHAAIDVFFVRFETAESRNPNSQLLPAADPSSRPRRFGRRLVLEALEPEVIADLAARARQSGRSPETEAKAILGRAARSGRGELAAWAAALRDRQRESHPGDPGDLTADIRKDRDR